MIALRILHIVRQFHPSVGGLEDFVLALAKQQQNEGLSPEVLTLNRLIREPEARLPAEDLVDGVPVRRIGYWGPARYPVALGALGHLQEFDLIHVHAVDFFCDYLALTRFIHGKPMVLSTHGGFFHTTFARSFKKLFFTTVTRASLSQYDCVVANSVNDLELFRRIARKRLVMIENGVNTQKFADSGSSTFKPSFIYLGRFSSNKGLDNLVDSFELLADQVPGARLYIVGNDFDGLYPKLQNHIDSLRHGGNIQVLMGLSDAEIRETMKDCSFFVSASEYEGFGQTVVEAMSAGLLPVVNRIPSFQEMIEASSVGRLTDFSKPSVAAGDMAALMSEATSHFPHARAEAIAASDRYSWAGTAKRFTEVYERVLGTRRDGLKSDGGKRNLHKSVAPKAS